MSYRNINVGKDGPALIITLNRPEKRNALSVATMQEIIAAARSGEADQEVRGIVLTGGTKGFCAGADLEEALQVKGPADGAFFEHLHGLANALEALKKPVLAAIEGYCITGGLELALACDIRIGAQGSTYAITSSRIGTIPGAGGTQRLPRVVGTAKALELLFSADVVDAQEAHRIGLINRLTDKGGAMEEAKRMVAVYAERGPLSLAFIKRAVHQGMQMDLASGLELEKALETAIYCSEDKQEGITAFFEKRKPVFKGR